LFGEANDINLQISESGVPLPPAVPMFSVVVPDNVPLPE
jgi:hypothetical protein